MTRDSRASVSGRIRRLIHSLRGRDHDDPDREDDSADKPPALPFLPAQRRPLTPIASQESLVALGSFANLPPELRRRVLIAAVGERTLHLDLRLAYPVLPLDQRSVYYSWAPKISGTLIRAINEHGGGTAPLSSYYPPDRTATKAWRWWSCVCHSQLPPDCKPAQRVLSSGVELYRYPNHDNCIRGDGTFCQLWAPGWLGGPGRCAIGVMGWLVACRQAYVEGIDVLYSTNTFFIESPAIFDALFSPGPRNLLLPERLASITSLELRWEVLLFGSLPDPSGDRHHHRSNEDRVQLASHLRNLCHSFPNLHTLVLTFSHHLYNDYSTPPANVLDEIDHVLLRPLANAVTRLPLQVQQHHVVVELPSNIFDALCKAAETQALGLEVDHGQRARSWSDVNGVWLRYPTSAPQPRLDASHSARNELDESGSISNSGFFYHIKAGIESDLYWDDTGRARSRSYTQAINCGG